MQDIQLVCAKISSMMKITNNNSIKGISDKEKSGMPIFLRSFEFWTIDAYGQFLRTAGPHFPASQRHNKRTVKFQAIKSYAAKGALHE